MTATVHGFGECRIEAARLANALGIRCSIVPVRAFPDGESLVTVTDVGTTAYLYRSLDGPNAKLVEVILAASALRDSGASRVVLVAPYLAYMRQDQAFHPGEAVSQRVIGQLIAHFFDGLVTVDPHLHRTPTLDAVVPGIAAANVSAAATIAQSLAAEISADTILVGPDSESRQWVEAIAAPLGLEIMIGEKHRLGDRSVELVLPDIARARGRPVILVDDMISSGVTLCTCAARLREAQATRIAAIATHCLASDADLARLAASGIAPVQSTDTIPGLTATIAIAPALADAIRELGF